VKGYNFALSYQFFLKNLDNLVIENIVVLTI